MSGRREVVDPAAMSTAEIQSELRHDLRVYEQVQHPLSKEAMAYRIDCLVREMDKRVAAAGSAKENE